MRKAMNPRGRGPSGILAGLFLLVAATVAAGLSGCAAVNFEMGRKFDANVLEQSLRTGDSTQADVRQALGEPFGTGRALMPFHESPRTVWSYIYQGGSFNVGSGESDSNLQLLFVFFAGDRFDGYMWNAAKLESPKTQ